jgi:hypothetical protein
LDESPDRYDPWFNDWHTVKRDGDGHTSSHFNKDGIDRRNVFGDNYHVDLGHNISSLVDNHEASISRRKFERAFLQRQEAVDRHHKRAMQAALNVKSHWADIFNGTCGLAGTNVKRGEQEEAYMAVSSGT